MCYTHYKYKKPTTKLHVKILITMHVKKTIKTPKKIVYLNS